MRLESKTTPRVTTPKVMMVVVVCILVFWVATVPVLMWFESDVGKRGQIGDAFGAINALFSGLAIAGVVYAILQQNDLRDLQFKAIQIQQEDLALQREHFERREGRESAQVLVTYKESQSDGNVTYGLYVRNFGAVTITSISVMHGQATQSHTLSLAPGSADFLGLSRDPDPQSLGQTILLAATDARANVLAANVHTNELALHHVLVRFA